MAADKTKFEYVDESKPKIDPSVLEFVFGSPDSPKTAKNKDLLNEEKKHGALLPRNKENDSEQPNKPLLSTNGEPKAPLAPKEVYVDELDEPDKPPDHTPYPGIDDGLLETGTTEPKHDEGGTADHKPDDDAETLDHDLGTDGKWHLDSDEDEPDYPDYGNGFGPRFDDRPVSAVPGVTPDVNTYQQKKNLAQGMMDLALLSANANQLRYVLESSANHPYYYSSLTFISLSIVLQIGVGIGLIMNSRYDVKDQKEICKADKINNMTVLGIFLITTVNVFIAAFSVATPTVSAPGTQLSG